MSLQAQTMRVVLAMATLFGALPCWQHAHPGAGAEHSHHAGGCRLADETTGDGELRAADSHAHRHLWLLGFELTIPVGAEPSGSDDEAPFDGAIVFLAPEASGVYSPQDPPNTLGWLSAFEAPPAYCLAPARAQATFRAQTAMTTSLCDTARHERSGVQLA